jgi:hypothetical protein
MTERYSENWEDLLIGTAFENAILKVIRPLHVDIVVGRWTIARNEFRPSDFTKKSC